MFINKLTTGTITQMKTSTVTAPQRPSSSPSGPCSPGGHPASVVVDSGYLSLNFLQMELHNVLCPASSTSVLRLPQAVVCSSLFFVRTVQHVVGRQSFWVCWWVGLSRAGREESMGSPTPHLPHPIPAHPRDVYPQSLGNARSPTSQRV